MDEILNKYYHENNNYYSHFRYDENDNEFDIAKEIIEYLESQNIKQFNVEVSECFNSCGYSCDMLCCAWIDNSGKLKTKYILLECM